MDVAGAFWGRNWRQLHLLIDQPGLVEMRIPSYFWDRWGNRVAHQILIQDPVGNEFHCRVRHQELPNGESAGFFTHELTDFIYDSYDVRQPVRISLKMLLPHFFLIRVKFDDTGLDINYPWLFINQNNHEEEVSSVSTVNSIA